LTGLLPSIQNAIENEWIRSVTKKQEIFLEEYIEKIARLGTTKQCKAALVGIDVCMGSEDVRNEVKKESK
jgi:hypothetical protein